MLIFNFNVVFICKILNMYASLASLLRLPPPRKKVTRGKFAPAGQGCLLVMHPTPAGVLCGAGTPASDALAGRGRPEATVWRILGTLKGQVIRGALGLLASDAREEILP
jgi:hypothetical protein